VIMATRFVFAALSIAFAIAVVFAVVTTIKRSTSSRAGASATRVG